MASLRAAASYPLHESDNNDNISLCCSNSRDDDGEGEEEEEEDEEEEREEAMIGTSPVKFPVKSDRAR